jgi:hypothetical protein
MDQFLWEMKNLPASVVAAAASAGRITINGKIDKSATKEGIVAMAEREKNSHVTVIKEELQEGMLTLSNESELANKPYDEIGVAVHGVWDQTNKKPYNGGQASWGSKYYSQTEIVKSISMAIGNKKLVIASCFRTWKAPMDSASAIEGLSGEPASGDTWGYNKDWDSGVYTSGPCWIKFKALSMKKEIGGKYVEDAAKYEKTN